MKENNKFTFFLYLPASLPRFFQLSILSCQSRNRIYAKKASSPAPENARVAGGDEYGAVNHSIHILLVNTAFPVQPVYISCPN
jgi:hypothetical protein